MQDIVIQKNGVKFKINDVDLLIDPIQISIYKEGLNYSWKTLRTKASSKIVNGNSIFHLKLNLIFTKSMFLEMHRLVCQIRNTPYVQVDNELVSESLWDGTGTRPVFFTVNSLQLIPRADSPFTVDMELDLRYFNHKPYGELAYKNQFETLPHIKEKKQYSYTFDVFSDNGRIEMEIQEKKSKTSSKRKVVNTHTVLKRSIRKYNSTTPVVRASSSNAYKRYSNYLQIKNLIECFGFDAKRLEDLLKNEGVNSRTVVSLCKINSSVKEEIYNDFKIYGNDEGGRGSSGYVDTLFTYQEYYALKLKKEENKRLREYFEKQVEGIEDYNERKKKIQKAKLNFLKSLKTGRGTVGGVKYANFYDQVKGFFDDKRVNYYTERSSVNNIIFFNNQINVTQDKVEVNSEGSIASTACITSFSCGFTNMFSTIPIVGQEYPTHQYLGASEPVYNVNVLLPSMKHGSVGPERGLGEVGKLFERMRFTLQKNAKDFKRIPDAGYFGVENFFTKLLGSKKREINPGSLKQRNNFILRNFNLSTVEGAPGSKTLQFSFCETNDFVEEELGRVYTKGGSNDYLSRVNDELTKTSPTQRPKKRGKSSKYEYMNWKTQYFSSDPTSPNDFYFSWVERGRDLKKITEEQDEKAFEFCRDYLDRIQAYLPGRKVNIGSSVDRPFTGTRKGASRHYSGAAVDISVADMSPGDLAKAVHDALGGKVDRFGVIAYYPDEDSFNQNKKMTGFLKRSFFVHVDDRTIVNRAYKRDTDGKKTYINDEITITRRNAGTYYGLDIADVLRGKPPATNVSDFYNTSFDINNGAVPADPESEEKDVDVENILNSTDIRQRLKSFINPFGAQMEEEYSDVEVKKFKDLEEEEQNIVQSIRPNSTSVNPELSVSIIEEANNTRRQELISSLKKQGINYSVEGNQVFIPRSSSNRAIVTKNKQMNAYLKMLDNFYKLASLMLTEPILYTDSEEEAEKEKIRIRRVLKDEKVTPILFNSFEKFFDNISTLLEDAMIGGMLGVEAAAAVITAYKAGAASTATSVNPFKKVGSAILTGVTGSILVAQGQMIDEAIDGGDRYTDCMHHIRGIAGKYDIEKEYTEFKTLVPDSFQIKPDDSFTSFYQNISSSNQVALNFGLVSYYLMYESNLVKDFSTAAIDIVPKGKVALALGTYSKIKKTVDDKGYQLKGALSETLFMGELKRYHQYIFEFPYIRGMLDEEDFYDLYELKQGRTVTAGDLKRKFDTKDYIPYEEDKKGTPAHKYLYSVNQIADGGIANIDIPFTKAELKQNQENKLEYLKNLKESILEELGEFPEIQEVLGVNREVSIFELAEENAYPDITLPIDPSNPSNNVNLHPAFYFYDPVEESSTRWDYIRPELEKNINYIIDKSHAFYEALESGIYSGSERDFIRSKKGLELEVSKFPTYEKIIRDATDEVKSKLPGGSATSALPTKASGSGVVASVSTPTSPSAASELFKSKKSKFETLNKSFENMFGEAGSKGLKTGGKKGFIEKKELKKQAIDSCKGLLGVKKNIKKAFPTYRLYLIEEDSIESDKLSIYDDFYNYNGVKGFTVYSNKKLPTSTAVIQLQNISGVLDGTKPEVVRDIDIDQNLTPEEEAQQQASVSSVVMRPGINIQLRAGYESNPTKLDIIFTGRVTEVKNSSAGEMLEVVAQSFGSELIARKYGLQDDSPIREKTFYNTHSLLGSLMFSEELRHFGRVKKGRLFQRGENKQISLDLDTGKVADWYNFSILGWTQRFFEDYGVYIFLATSLFQGLGGLIKRGGELSTKFLGGISTQISKIKNADLITGAATSIKAYTTSLASMGLLRGLANNVVGSNILKAAGSLGEFLLLKSPRFLFITIPMKIREGLKWLSLTKLLGGSRRDLIEGAIKQGVSFPSNKIEINSTAFQGILGRIGAIFSKRIREGQNLNLTVEAFNNLVIRKYGYAFASANKLLVPFGQGTGLGRSFFGSTQILGGGTILRNFATNYITALYVSAAIDSIVSIFNLAGKGLSYLWGERLNPPTTRIMLGPQDDNIYPPAPEKYLVQSNGWDKYIKEPLEGVKNIGINIALSAFGIFGYTDAFDDDTQAKIIKNAYLKSDNRLDTSKHENEYKVFGSTIWEVLHEMSLRHPGHLYGVRKYGDGLESRVFFGLSNQRCFVKDLPGKEIQLLNKIEAAIKRMDPKSTNLDADTVKDLLNIKKVEESELAEKTNQILDYWISKTRERFIPFRKYHSVDSEHDIIANNLRVQSNKVVNQVAITFQGEGNKESIYAMKALKHLSEDRINEKGINYKNCRGYAAACRYGMGELIHSAKEMYGGEILIVGNPKIDTNDICILTDDYSNMHGLFEVEAVTHMFSYETGFVTELVPNAVVFGNENYLGSISSSSIAFDAHRKLLDTYTNRNQLMMEGGKINDDLLEEIAEKALISAFSGTDSDLYNAIYGSVAYLGTHTDYSKLDSDDKAKLIKEVKESLKASVKDGSIFLEDITGNFNTGVLNTPINRSTLGVGLTTALVTSLLTLNPIKGFKAGAMVGVGSNLAARGAVDSVKSGYLGKNIFRDLLVSQIEEGHLIKVLPIVKDGTPLVAGGYEYVKQHQRFKDVFGNFFNPLSDAMEGFSTRVRELEEDYKMLGVSTYQKSGSFGVGLRSVPVSIAGTVGEWISDSAVPKEAIYMKLELEE